MLISDPLIEEICAELISRHGCHTVILYGSRADGSVAEGSDYDIAGFGGVTAPQRDARW